MAADAVPTEPPEEGGRRPDPPEMGFAERLEEVGLAAAGLIGETVSGVVGDAVEFTRDSVGGFPGRLPEQLAGLPGSLSGLPGKVAHVAGDVEESGFDPVPPGRRLRSNRPRGWRGHPWLELRWQTELVRLMVDPVYRGEGLPRGHGQPVLAIPGFLAGDASLSVLRDWLRRLGYTPFRSGISYNVDCSDRTLLRLERRLRRIHRRTGQRVALVGHSRGGHLAKALATRHPDLIDRMVSLGSPLADPMDISRPTKRAVAATRAILTTTSRTAAENGCFTRDCRCPFTRDFTAEFPGQVPLTSVFTRGDGVVWWESCRVDYGANIEVRGSHLGLAFNRAAYREIAYALAEVHRRG